MYICIMYIYSGSHEMSSDDHNACHMSYPSIVQKS